MKKYELLQLMQSGESDILEFKQSLDKTVIESIVAFSNTKGGILLIGIKNDSTLLGVQIGLESIQNYINQIKNSTEPSLIIDIDKVIVDKKEVLFIKVDEFPIKPVSFKGKYYKRVTNSNHQMNLTEISNMHIQSLQLSWDSYPASDIEMNGINKSKLDKFFTKLKETGRFPLTDDVKTDLLKLNLLKDAGIVTNAAKLLFAKEMNF